MLRERLEDAETWRPTTANLSTLWDLVAERRHLNKRIHDEVNVIRDAGVSWSDIAEVLGVKEDAARRVHERPPR